MAALIARVGPYAPDTSREGGTHFAALLRAIVFQQLSGKAAGTIHGRVLDLMDGTATPAGINALSDEALRGAGLSRGKLAAARSLADRFLADPLPEDLDHLDDAAIIRALVSVRGIGEWSAQMFLMFRLGRLDVLPSGDLGVRKGVQRLDRLPEMPTPKEVIERAKPWRPYASVASWYLWRLTELPEP